MASFSERIQVVIDVVTDKALKATKDLSKTTSQLNDELGDTKSHALRVADALDASTAQMVSDLKAADKAAKALSTALGPELTAKISSARVDEFVGRLRQAGVSFDDITSNADRFAESLHKMDAASGSLEDVHQAAARTGEELGKSKSVMANFVGNAVQELPGISDAFGPLNMAVGQFAEYATEGDVTLSSFLKTAGPIAAIGAGFAIFSSIMGELGRHEKEVKEQAEKLVKVQNELADAQYQTAAKDLSDQYGDLIGKAKKYGLTTQDVVDTLQGNNKAVDVLRSKYDELVAAEGNGRTSSDKSKGAYFAQRSAILDLIDSLTTGQEAYAKSGDTVKNNTTVTNELAAALQNNAKGADDAASAEARRTEAASKAKAMAQGQLEVEQALTNAYLARNASLFDVERTQLQLDNTYTDLKKSEADLTKTVNDAKKSADEKATAMRDLRIKTLDAADAVLTAAQDYAKSQGATENSNAAIKIQIDYLKQQRDRYPELSAEINAYIDNLNKIPKTVTTDVKVIGGLRRYASGTSYHPGGVALVGEEGPELVDLPAGSRVFTASQTSGMAQSVGGVGIAPTINVTVMPGAGDAATGQAIVDSINAFYRAGGNRLS